MSIWFYIYKNKKNKSKKQTQKQKQKTKARNKHKIKIKKTKAEKQKQKNKHKNKKQKQKYFNSFIKPEKPYFTRFHAWLPIIKCWQSPGQPHSIYVGNTDIRSETKNIEIFL